MYQGRPDLKLINLFLSCSPFSKINKRKYISSIKSYYRTSAIPENLYDSALDLYVDHINSDLFTAAGRRFHSIMTKESLKQGCSFLETINSKAELYNDPVFIIGLPRSGTTNMHNMIINDFGYNAFEYWELASPKKMFNNSLIDKNARKFRSLLGFYIYRYLIPSLQRMHKVNMSTYEECWHFQKNLFLCYNYAIQLKHPELQSLIMNNDFRFIFEGYKQFMILNQSNKNQHFSLKCPEHLMFTDTIDTVFPNSTLIWIHRDPFESIVSYCSMIEGVWNLFMGKTNKSDLADFIISLYKDMIQKMISDRDKINCRIIDVSYNDLINNRKKVNELISPQIKSYNNHSSNRKRNPSFFKNKSKPKKYPVIKREIDKIFTFYIDKYSQYL